MITPIEHRGPPQTGGTRARREGEPRRSSAGRRTRRAAALAATLCLALLASACSTAAHSPRGATTAREQPAAAEHAAGTSQPATAPGAGQASAAPTAPSGHYLTAIAVGAHSSFDRVVFQFTGGLPGYRAEYVAAVWQDAKGTPVPLPGQAFLRVVFHPASEVRQNPSGSPASTRTYTGPGTLSPYFPTLLQVGTAGDYEGYLSFGIGLSGHAGLHVFTLTNPDRVVIDVTHVRLPAFPGIWDITSWHQYWIAQSAFENGHQPWLASPAMVVQAWAAGRFAKPTIQPVGPDTFRVTEPGTSKVSIVSGTRPVRTGPAQLWVITKVVNVSR
jgi:hypothetical protein